LELSTPAVAYVQAYKDNAVEVLQVEAAKHANPAEKLRTNITVDLSELLDGTKTTSPDHKNQQEATSLGVDSLTSSSSMTLFTSTPTPTPGAQPTAPTDSPPSGLDYAKFAKLEYHFVVDKPEKESFAGQLAITGYDRSRHGLSIEPPEFRNWFRIDRRVSRVN